jgi:uncharacterized Zn ribbon protein
MSKQTATDYLIQEIKNDSLVQAKSTKEWNEVFRKAKQMEKEQIMDAANKLLYHSTGPSDTAAKQYYNETYGGQDE